ncbi:23S rRNA (uracil(1939)-C(5))-methyltransferase RlmD [Butyrivibrio sp. AE2032]|uniref:23S rRNA (uracil(1939)-C(5))-methyltransferase RlmD n=1 Tax=Butyrivibrio sp. AE2032 TaxID=1458463 RepID=UPI000556D504|nr:23S rRNA (uracil(1939)-C(5))-methyltransferase RlmD [Butyrivibrio sp. AE2032]
MKKKDIVEGIVRKVEFPNKGIVETNEGKVVVKGVLPDQKVSVQIQKVRKDRAEGRLLEVLEEPSDAIESPCIHFGKCGGCSYLTMPYVKELGLKEQQVRTLLKPAMDRQTCRFTWEGIKTSPVKFAYRNKMEFTFGDEVMGGPLCLGMHKRGSFYDIVTVSGCRIVDDDYKQILSATLDFFSPMYERKEITFYHRMKQVGYLRHLLVRKAVRTGDILVDIITTTQEEHDLTAYKDMLLSLDLSGKIVGVLHTKNDSLADAVIDEGTEILFGQDFFYEYLLGLKFRITPFSFFQTNSLSAEVLYTTVRGYIRSLYDQKKINKDGVIYDLYSGTGTIAQLLAKVCDKVIGVEIVEEAVEAARENARLNNLDNCEFICGDVLKVLDEIEVKPDMIVLDPPRDGINPKALQKIIGYGVQYMIYVSCKPTSLARDLEILQENGYMMTRAVAIDQFPWTNHCETVVLLSQQKPDDHIEIEINLDEIDATSAESKATYKEIEEWVQEHYGFHVTNLNIAQVKQKHGIIERENYNKPKSENSRQPGCPEEKVKAIEEALKHFQMI